MDKDSPALRYTCLQTIGQDLRGCGLVFGSWDELKEHEKTHVPALPLKRWNQFSCHFCDSELIESATGGLVYFTDAQSALAAKDARIERLTELLKLVQTDAGNWLHAKLQDAIDIAAGPPGPYRSVRDSGLPLVSTEAPGG